MGDGKGKPGSKYRAGSTVWRSRFLQESAASDVELLRKILAAIGECYQADRIGRPKGLFVLFIEREVDVNCRVHFDWNSFHQSGLKNPLLNGVHRRLNQQGMA